MENNALSFVGYDKYNHNNNNNKEYYEVSGDIITEQGRKQVLEKIQILSKKKPLISEQIKDARENGGVEENEEFSMALEEMMRLDMEIMKLQFIAETYTIIPTKAKGDYSKVEVGLSVTVKNLSTDKIITYTILGEMESDPSEGVISHKSPVGKELIGCSIGDVAYIERNKDYIELEILKIFAK